MPILGIIASSFRSGAGPEGAYDSLATVSLSATTATVTFAGIPSGYKHLQLRIMGRSTRTSSPANKFTYTFNGSATGYGYSHFLYGEGSGSAIAGNANGSTYAFGTPVATDASTSGIMGVAVMDVLDYANVNKYKTTRILGGEDSNGSGEIYLTSGLWQNTAAITSISLSIDSFNWAANTTIALYGVK
jgi:hypothetical protein